MKGFWYYNDMGVMSWKLCGIVNFCICIVNIIRDLVVEWVKLFLESFFVIVFIIIYYGFEYYILLNVKII